MHMCNVPWGVVLKAMLWCLSNNLARNTTIVPHTVDSVANSWKSYGVYIIWTCGELSQTTFCKLQENNCCYSGSAVPSGSAVLHFTRGMEICETSWLFNPVQLLYIVRIGDYFCRKLWTLLPCTIKQYFDARGHFFLGFQFQGRIGVPSGCG